MTSPLCVATGGWCRRVFHYRLPTPMYRNSPPLCTIVLQIPSLMPLKMRKVQLMGSFRPLPDHHRPERRSASRQPRSLPENCPPHGCRPRQQRLAFPLRLSGKASPALLSWRPDNRPSAKPQTDYRVRHPGTTKDAVSRHVGGSCLSAASPIGRFSFEECRIATFLGPSSPQH